MPRYEEFQFIVTPVLLLEEDDRSPRAVQAEPRVLHGVDELLEFAHQFDDNLEQLNAAANNGKVRDGAS